MRESLDLTILPLCRLNGQEVQSLPGLRAVSPPRRAARGRERDRLMLFLTISGNTVISTAEYLQMTSQAAEVFYQSMGSVTASLRSTAISLNQTLLERNLSTTGSGHYAIGWLVLGAVRGNQIFLAQSGTTHVFWLGAGESRHIFDQQLSGRGLGISQTTNINYSQLSLSSGDRLLFCGPIHSSWVKAFLEDRSPTTLDVTRRRLFSLADGDIHAILVQAQAGKGDITVLHPGQPEQAAELEATPPRSQPILQPSIASGTPSVQEGISPVPISPDILPEQVPPRDQPPAYSIPPQSESYTPAIPGDTSPSKVTYPTSLPQVKPQDEEQVIPKRRGSTPARSNRIREGARKVVLILVSGKQAWKRMTEKTLVGLRRFLPRLLPGTQSDIPSLPPGLVMFVIAVAVPLIIATIAGLVYFRTGRSMQYREYFEKAELIAASTTGQSDPIALRKAWEETLYYVSKAEEYQETSQSQSLRQQAQNSLDTLLGIVRLDYKAGLNDLPNPNGITRMAADDLNLYMLDAKSGNVLRAYVTDHRYQIDNTFRCDPGIYNDIQVGSLVDIVIFPKTIQKDAAVVGIDSMGNLLYCVPDLPAEAKSLVQPNTNWKQVTAFAFDANNLYVLDAPARAVWIYPYDFESGGFTSGPTFYFSDQVPQLETVIDIAVNGDDLYLLHADGHLATCSYSRLEAVPTRCIDPNPIVDPHPAAQGSEGFAQTRFIQIMFSPPPDSAVLLLDADGRSIYRLSPHSLELQNQLHAFPGDKNPLPSGILTAMTVNTSHVLFLAYEDRVVFALDVP